MAGVPEKVLNWLYSVLPSVTPRIFIQVSCANVTHVGIRRRKPYLPRRRRNPLQLPVPLPAHRSLQFVPSTTTPRIEHTLTASAYENGASALLLLLSGTVPVTFRNTTYGFPVHVWVPHAYPRESPMVYVKPSHDMLVRPGQHVSGDGRVYHPYLAQWGKYWDVSCTGARCSWGCYVRGRTDG
jgi:ESCRT-I complex subunit TSG101